MRPSLYGDQIASISSHLEPSWILSKEQGRMWLMKFKILRGWTGLWSSVRHVDQKVRLSPPEPAIFPDHQICQPSCDMYYINISKRSFSSPVLPSFPFLPFPSYFCRSQDRMASRSNRNRCHAMQPPASPSIALYHLSISAIHHNITSIRNRSNSEIWGCVS